MDLLFESKKHKNTDFLFYINLELGEQAQLRYRLFGVNKVDFYSSYVPNAFREQGLASKMVAQGLKWAEEEKLDVHASCSYVSKVFVNKELKRIS